MTYDEFWALPDNAARAAAFERLSLSQRAAVRILPKRHELWPYRNKRVEVVTTYGEKRRFYVGMSTGWQPCLLEIPRRDSLGGLPCESGYASFRVVGSR